MKSRGSILMLVCCLGDFTKHRRRCCQGFKNIGITLTAGSATETALAGFPHHSINYLPKLVKAGLRVAICDQLEDPKMTKNIVKRGVTELVTPEYL
jgi:DNA mismatch repair ATPase MutS